MPSTRVVKTHGFSKNSDSKFAQKEKKKETPDDISNNLRRPKQNIYETTKTFRYTRHLCCTWTQYIDNQK
eukprot:m.256013 g.256013  ORF g.256013 m.256013 type:complete len:70 (-) comp34014_c0_seq1:30-239(-)